MADTKTRIVLDAVDQTKAAFDSVQGNLGRVSGGVGTLNGVLGRLAPLIGAATFTAFIKQSIDAADAMNDLKARTSLNIETLAGLELVAKLGDTSLETLGKSVNRLSIFMAENAERTRQLGISAQDPEEAFLQLADVLSNVESVNTRNSIANELLGRSYSELLPVLLQGSDALREQIARGKELNPITAESARQAGIFNDRLDELTLGSRGFGIEMANDVLPSLNNIISAMQEASKEGGFLYTLFIGLGGVGDLIFNGTEIVQAKDRITDLKIELSDLQDAIKTGQTAGLIGRFIYGSKEERDKRVAELTAEIANAEKAFERLTNPPEKPAPPALGGDDPDVKGTDTKTPTQTLREQLALLQQENNLVAQGVPLEDAKTIAKLKQQGITDDLIVQNLNLNQIARQLAAEEKAATDAKTKAAKDELDAQKLIQDAIKKGDEERANFMKEQGERDILGINLREKITTDLQAQTDALNFQLSIQGLSTEEQQKQQALRMAALEFEQAMNELNQAGVYLSEEETETLKAQYDELARLNGQLSKTQNISQDLGLTFESAFEDAIADGAKLSDVLQSLEKDLLRILTRRTITEPFKAGVDSLLNGFNFGDFFNGIFNANGNAFDSNGVVPFAKGGIVDKATPFTFANGGKFGVMGEAGPEAILPLSRGPNGKLGVQSSGMGGATVTVNIIGAPQQPQVQQRDDGNGNTSIDVIFEAITANLAKDIRSEGNFAQTLQGQYGLNRAAGAR